MREIDVPKITLQQFKTHIILSRGARYDLIFKSSILDALIRLTRTVTGRGAKIGLTLLG